MYQQNPLLEAINPYYNGRRTALAFGSALTGLVGYSTIKNNNIYQLMHIITCIYECTGIHELEECCNYYRIDNLFYDVYHHYKAHRMSFKECQEHIAEELRERLKQYKLNRKVGYGLSALGGTGLALTMPKELKAWKWALKH